IMPNYQPLVNETLSYFTLQNVPYTEDVEPFDSICGMNPVIPDDNVENCPSHPRKKVVVKVSLYTNEAEPKPHVYELIGKNAGGVTIDENFLAKFQYLDISKKKKEEVLEILKERKKKDHTLNGISYDEASIEEKALEERKSFTSGSTKLCFQAFSTDNLNIPLSEKLFSNPINNQKDIKVRFYDEESDWEAYGEFNLADIHHQVAIVLKTPPYQRHNVKKTVYIELVRPSDSKFSVARQFEYIPDEDDGMLLDKKMQNMQTVVKNSKIPWLFD
ncbi:unnamed protein product, partial [Larinioides sclopetarius]